MRKLFFTLILIAPLVVFSQKIKIKKEVISFDGNEIAKVNTKIRNNYKFSTLSGEKAFDVVFHGLDANAIDGFQWLELISADGKKTEIPYEVVTTSFSVTKLIIRLLKDKYELFDNSSLKMGKVAEFFAENRENLSDKYMKAVVTANADTEERKAKVGRYNPFVKDDGLVVFGGSQGTKIVGRAHYNNNSYSITDLDRITVATAKGCTTCTKVNANTYTNEDFEFDYGSRTMMTGRFSRQFAQLFVEELIGRGYHFGHEAKTYNKKLHSAKVAVAKESSINLYGVPGSITDKDGKTYSGTVYAIFEKLELNPAQQESNLYDMNHIDKYGKFVSVKYLNDKGRPRFKKFTARSKATFCATDEGEEKCFYSMKTKGNALKKISNATNLGFDNSYFYKAIHKAGENMVLSKPGEDNLYILKFSDKEIGFMIDTRKNDRISDALSKFISNCKSLSADIKNKEFDLSNPENLKQIVDEYNLCK